MSAAQQGLTTGKYGNSGPNWRLPTLNLAGAFDVDQVILRASQIDTDGYGVSNVDYTRPAFSGGDPPKN